MTIQILGLGIGFVGNALGWYLSNWYLISPYTESTSLVVSLCLIYGFPSELFLLSISSAFSISNIVGHLLKAINLNYLPPIIVTLYHFFCGMNIEYDI